MNLPKEILIVGLGLMGGSYASALSKKGYTVNAITIDQRSIDFAKEKGWINYGTTELDSSLIGNADFVIFALYPHVFVDWITNNQQLLKSGAIITDVTGVKGSIVNKVQSILRQDVEFIAAHPMAGREAYGVEYSDDSVFHGANYIVVPTEKNSDKAIEICKCLGIELGFSNITTLSADEHDSMIAFLSQLTHCIAVSLMCACDKQGLEQYTGDSFRDLTRIARINDEMWSELFLENRESLLNEMDNFKNSFDKLYNTIKNSNRNEMREMMRLSTERRERFNKRNEATK